MNKQQRTQIYNYGTLQKPLFTYGYPGKAGDILALILFKAVDEYDFSEKLENIAAMLGIREKKTIIKSLKWLEDKGLIEKTHGGGGLRRDGTGFTNRYKPNFGAILEEARKWDEVDNVVKNTMYGSKKYNASKVEGGKKYQQPRTNNYKRFSAPQGYISPKKGL